MAPERERIASARDKLAERRVLRCLGVDMNRPRIVFLGICDHRIGIGDYFLPPKDGALNEILEGHELRHHGTPRMWVRPVPPSTACAAQRRRSAAGASNASTGPLKRLVRLGVGR